MAFTSASGRTQTALSDINVTPLVDVVLVLLIIFMVTAPVSVWNRSQRASYPHRQGDYRRAAGDQH
jgi:biopolymer transport protein ExbD